MLILSWPLIGFILYVASIKLCAKERRKADLAGILVYSFLGYITAFFFIHWLNDNENSKYRNFMSKELF